MRSTLFLLMGCGYLIAASEARAALPVSYEAAAGDPDPAAQGWSPDEVVVGSDTAPADGVIDAGANAGPVADGAGVAWQVNDQLGGAGSDLPRYTAGIAPADLQSAYDNGWTFRAVVRAGNPPGNLNPGATSGFAGWSLSATDDPGWGLTAGSGEVGFTFSNAEGVFSVTASGGGGAALGDGSAEAFHTIEATAAPQSAVFEWFLDGVFQGAIDLRSAGGGGPENRVAFGARHPARTGEVSEYRHVEFAAGHAGALPPDVLPVARAVQEHRDSLIGNGIDTATGAFFQGVELLRVEGVRPLTFDIAYNSRLTALAGPLGPGWSHNYEARLVGSPGGDVVVNWDSHRRSRFTPERDDPDVELFVGVDEDVQFASLFRWKIANPPSPGEWVLELEDGETFFFDQETGRLVGVENVVRQEIGLSYDAAGRLAQLEEPHSGVSIHLGYDASNRISTVSDDLGREVVLGYDSTGRLVRVPAPVLPEEAVSGGDFAPQAIPDNNPAGRTVTIPVPEGGYIGGVVTESLRINHSRPTDLTITIVSPSGTELPVPSVANGGPTVVDYAGTLFEGFEGEDRNGDWTLRVVDSVPGASGSVEAFKLSFSESSRAVVYTYDGAAEFPQAGRIVAASDVVSDPIFEAGYDASGRIIRQGDGRPETPDATISFAPLAGGTTETVYTDPLGHPWRFTHDGGFHLLSVSDPLGNSVTFTYDALGNRLTRTDALGRQTTFTYSKRGDVATVTDPAGNTTSFNHTFSHNVVEITDALGRETSMIYLDDRLTAVTDALQHTDRKEYHNNGQISRVLLHDNADIRFDLNPQGRTGRVSNPDDPDAERNLDYDLAGRLVRSTDYDDNETLITYTPSDDVRSEADPDGNVSRRDFDHRGRLVRQVDRRGAATTYTYDGNGNILATTNALGETTTFAYDQDDRLVTTTNPRGATVRYTYDAAGRRTAETDPLGRTTTTGFDAVGNVVATYDQAGVRASRVVYDDRDIPVLVEDALGHTITATFDEVARKTMAIDELGRTTTFAYDELDRPVSVTDPAGRTATYTYQSDDVVDEFQGPGAENFELTYDRSNNLRKVQSFYGRAERFTYDARNLMTETETPSGKVIEYRYDGLGRLVRSAPVSPVTQDRTRGYEYDPEGNLTVVGIPDASGEVTPHHTRTYDPLGRLSTYTDVRGQTLVYLYDPAGNLAGLVYPGGETVDYTYDLADRLETVTDWDGRVTRFAWDERDRLTRISFPNGTRRDLRYDSAGNILYREDLAADGSTIVAYRYSYDATGRLQSEQAAPESPPVTAVPATYTYDLENRLQTVDGETVNLDPDGNVTGGPDGTPMESLAYNHRGKLFRTSRHFHFYDIEDRLVGWEPRGGSLEDRVDFTVDPAGLLSRILAKDGPGTDLVRFVYGVGLLYQEDAASGDIRVFHYDHRGSTVALSDSTGQVVGQVDYDPYGRVAARAGDTDTIFLYHGLFGVATSPDGLNYMRFRWYSPDLRRFLSKDAHLGSLASLGSFNRFAFAGANPAMFADPEGEFFWFIGGAVVGAAVNTAITFIADVADDGQINTLGEEYAAAAIGGAVTGALTAATGGVGGAILAGAAGAAVENLALAGLRGEAVDPFDLAIDTVVGGAAGGVGRTAGKLGGKLGARTYGKLVGKPGKFARFASNALTPAKISRRRAVGSFGELLKRSAKKEATQSVRRLVLKSATTLGIRKPAGVLIDSLRGMSRPGLATAATNGSNGVGDIRIISTAVGDLNSGRLKAYGEYIHYDLYQDALNLAGRPVPTHPNNTLTGF